MRLLLISNSTNAGETYLNYPKNDIKEFLAADNVKTVVFIPYAAVTFSYDEYESKVRSRFDELGIKVESIHRSPNPVETILTAEAIVAGGGNTFHLLKNIQDKGLVELIKRKVHEGTPYVGWSAGSNLACPTICTTNDMPIVRPKSFDAFGFVPFQINPHYSDAHLEGHAGETREQRIEEYMAANRAAYTAGLREGCMLRIEGESLKLIGNRTMRIFKYGKQPIEVSSADDLGYMLTL